MAMMADGVARAGPGSVAEAPGEAIPQHVAERLVAAGRRMDGRGWVPATSGNLSARLPGERLAITRSGVHKGFLETRDIIAVDFSGRSLTPGMKPSAETLLHCQIYSLWPEVGSVLHGHSVPATALTMALPGASAIHLGATSSPRMRRRSRCRSSTMIRTCRGLPTGCSLC
jgi:ribulose-5-phosphate 4-epimerase/fuculose-1-phosphate aldolase